MFKNEISGETELKAFRGNRGNFKTKGPGKMEKGRRSHTSEGEDSDVSETY